MSRPTRRAVSPYGVGPVTICPGYSFGRPAIHGIRCEHVAGRVAAGDAVEAVAHDYGIDPREVALACWYVATYERRRKAWRPWWGRVPDRVGA